MNGIDSIGVSILGSGGVSNVDSVGLTVVGFRGLSLEDSEGVSLEVGTSETGVVSCEGLTCGAWLGRRGFGVSIPWMLSQMMLGVFLAPGEESPRRFGGSVVRFCKFRTHFLRARDFTTEFFGFPNKISRPIFDM